MINYTDKNMFDEKSYKDFISSKVKGSKVTLYKGDGSYIAFDFKIDKIANYVHNNFKSFTGWSHLQEEIQKLKGQTSL